jgi:hypothetical protein
MNLSLMFPRYKHRKLSVDEMIGRSIADPLDPASQMPQTCNKCGAVGTAAAPLMMKPFFRMDHGGPKGTLYQCWCWRCHRDEILAGRAV